MQAHKICKELYIETPTIYLFAALMRQNITLIKQGSLPICSQSLRDLFVSALSSANNFKTFILILTKVLREKS